MSTNVSPGVLNFTPNCTACCPRCLLNLACSLKYLRSISLVLGYVFPFCKRAWRQAGLRRSRQRPAGSRILAPLLYNCDLFLSTFSLLFQSIDRRERLRRLALETIDLAKDPYYMRNHLGQIECRLCLTIHPNEGNYLAHTQVTMKENYIELDSLCLLVTA